MSAWVQQSSGSEAWDTVGLWIMGGGFWNDAGEWVDGASWRDSPSWQAQANNAEAWT